MPLTPEQRALRGRIGAHKSWSQTEDRTARTQPARTAFLARFERQVDPDGTLPEAERTRRAEHAMRAHMALLAFNRERARAARKAAPAPPSGVKATLTPAGELDEAG